MAEPNETQFVLLGSDGAEIAAYRWGPGRATRVVQLAHGMGEHARRYPVALKPLFDAGYVVYANDHRGHGATAKPGQLGDFGPRGYDGVVDDMARLTALAQDENPDARIVLLGHSMGAMLAQGYILMHASKIAGVALSGSAAVDHVVQLANHPRGLEGINEPFEPGRTAFDWLSRDEAEVDKYIADPLCGFSLRPESMVSLFSQGARLADAKELSRIPKGFPIYIFSGLMDPVNAKGEWLRPLIDRYVAAGAEVTTDLYPDARHEVLNETNCVEVVTNLKRWLDKVTG